MKTLAFLSVLLPLAVGCSPLQSVPVESRAGSSAVPSFTAIPTLTAQPAPSATVTAPALQTYEPFSVSTWADNVALRKGPGYLFQRIGLLPKGTTLTVLSRSRGGEWALGKTADGRVGWIFIQLVDAGNSNWTTVPFSEPLGAQLVTGVVKDEAGVPISGIQFALTQGSGQQPLRTDAMTDATGTFYAYMPADVGGGWYLGYTAIACTSNVMDAGCNPKNGVGGKPYPEGQFVTLPMTASAPLEFVWK